MKNWNTGGIADSKRQGAQNASYTLKNCDIHSDPGVLKCAQSLVDAYVSGDEPNEPIVSIVPTIVGGVQKFYWFGNNSVWTSNTAGVFALLGSITVDTAHGVIFDAELFNGDIYFTMQERVGKYTPIATDVWANRDENFAAINFDVYHPLKVVQNDLYVGHTNNVGKILPSQTTGTLDAAAVVDNGGTPNTVTIPSTGHGLVENDSVVISGTTNYNGAFLVLSAPTSDTFVIESAYVAEVFAGGEAFSLNMEKGLLLESEYTVESFGAITRMLIVGTRQVGLAVDSFAGFSKIYKWDLISRTYSSEQPIKEFGISAFMEFNGSLLFNAGQDGNLYSYDGNFAQKYKRIPHSIANETRVSKNATSDDAGITIIGVSQSGDSGGYTLGGYAPNLPIVFNLPYHIPNAQITCVQWVGADLVFAYSVSGSRFIKKLSTTLAIAETETVIQPLLSSNGEKVAVTPKIQYEIFPTNTNIQLYGSETSGSYVLIPTTHQKENKQIVGRLVSNSREIQYKLILTPNGTTTPIIEFFG